MSEIRIEATGISGTDSGHLYLVFRDNSNNEFVIRGGPQNDNIFNFGNINVIANVPLNGPDNIFGTADDTRDARPNTPEALTERGSRVLDLGGRDAEEVWQTMIVQAQLIGNSNTNYDMLGPNSNTTIAGVLQAVGIDVNDVLPNRPELEGGPFTAPYPGIDDVEDLDTPIIDQNNHCFLAGTPIDMWPLDADLKPDANGNYDEKELLAKVWKKPIEQITEDDIVVALDENGRLKPGRVSRTMQNRSKYILDLFGLKTTPGHAFFCAEGKFKGQHVPIMDILRSDGCIQKADGTIIRAATNCEFGSLGDRMIKATACLHKPDGTFTEQKQGEVRFGTRIIHPGGRHMSFMEMALSHGWKVSDDGFMVANFKNDDGSVTEQKFFFPYTFGEDFPKPEDYVLKLSQVTTQDIYQHGEWEAGFPPRMPVPYAGEAGGSFKPNPTLQASAPPNIPLSMRNSPNQPTMTRKQRRAYEAKQRKVTKSRKRVMG